MSQEQGQGSHDGGHGGPLQHLREHLTTQIGHYRDMFVLEKELATAIGAKDFSRIAANTERKSGLMDAISRTQEELAPLLKQYGRPESGFEDEEAEKLRVEAVELLKEIQNLEHKNLVAITTEREGMLKGFKTNRQARKVARNYRDSATVVRPRFDAKS
jgi:hypothetical protein